ncbi:MAG: M20/M25/M40 family metallo-hydrolase [Anaerolineales bacterium]|nr:M20/M25/M40 family metallo-hydrolase [Anaerolineales bacterium]
MTAINLERLIENACALQQIPAPTFSEHERGKYIESRFKTAGLRDVSVDKIGNVYGRTPGSLQPAVVVSAHLDSVFPMVTQLEIHRNGSMLIGPGIGDNAVALAFLLEMAEAFVSQPKHGGSVWFVGNVREEGLGNLLGMQQVVDRFGDKVQAYIVLEGIGLGHIYHRGLQVQRYRVSVETRGGHAWIHSDRESAIHTLLEIGSEIMGLSRPEEVPTSINIGLIRGGTSINTIASAASMDLDLRSEKPQALVDLERGLQTICERHRASEVNIKQEQIGQRPGGAISPDHALVKLACEALEVGEVAECHLGIASTDANVPLSRGHPAVCVGLTAGGHAHTIDEYIDTETIPNGYRMLHHLISEALNLNPE